MRYNFHRKLKFPAKFRIEQSPKNNTEERALLGMTPRARDSIYSQVSADGSLQRGRSADPSGAGGAAGGPATGQAAGGPSGAVDKPDAFAASSPTSPTSPTTAATRGSSGGAERGGSSGVPNGAAQPPAAVPETCSQLLAIRKRWLLDSYLTKAKERREAALAHELKEKVRSLEKMRADIVSIEHDIHAIQNTSHRDLPAVSVERLVTVQQAYRNRERSVVYEGEF